MRWPWVSAARLDDAHHELHMSRGRVTVLEEQLDRLRADQLNLIERIAAPRPLPSSPIVQSQDEEAIVLAGLKQETIQALADHLVTDAGLSSKDAMAEARRMAREAESLFA